MGWVGSASWRSRRPTRIKRDEDALTMNDLPDTLAPIKRDDA
jgi:hypothetical protein